MLALLVMHSSIEYKSNPLPFRLEYGIKLLIPFCYVCCPNTASVHRRWIRRHCVLCSVPCRAFPQTLQTKKDLRRTVFPLISGSTDIESRIDAVSCPNLSAALPPRDDQPSASWGNVCGAFCEQWGGTPPTLCGRGAWRTTPAPRSSRAQAGWRQGLLMYVSSPLIYHNFLIIVQNYYFHQKQEIRQAFYYIMEKYRCCLFY